MSWWDQNMYKPGNMFTKPGTPGMTSQNIAPGKAPGQNAITEKQTVGPEEIVKFLDSLTPAGYPGGDSITITPGGKSGQFEVTTKKTSEAQSGGGQEGQKQGFDWRDPRQLSMFLGEMGQAVMGPYQESWPARLGKYAVESQQAGIMAEEAEKDLARQREYNRKILESIFGIGAPQSQAAGRPTSRLEEIDLSGLPDTGESFKEF